MNDKTHFGFQEVDISKKAEHVGDVFHSVAEEYDLMNDVMSFGLHRLWKKILIELAELNENSVVLDIASGTADIPKLISEKFKSGSKSITIKVAHTNLKPIKEAKKDTLKVVESALNIFNNKINESLTKTYTAYIEEINNLRPILTVYGQKITRTNFDFEVYAEALKILSTTNPSFADLSPEQQEKQLSSIMNLYVYGKLEQGKLQTELKTEEPVSISQEFEDLIDNFMNNNILDTLLNHNLTPVLVDLNQHSIKVVRPIFKLNFMFIIGAFLFSFILLFIISSKRRL